MHLSTSLVNDPVCVSNPIRGSAHLSIIYVDLKISILSIEFSRDAYILGFMVYGLILGMDWLSSFGAILDF